MIAAYVVECTEYERGWGSRPDGYLVFPSQLKAEAWMANETKDRKFGDAPDCYTSYDRLGPREVSQDLLNRVNASGHGFVYIDKLKELLAD